MFYQQGKDFRTKHDIYDAQMYLGGPSLSTRMKLDCGFSTKSGIYRNLNLTSLKLTSLKSLNVKY